MKFTNIVSFEIYWLCIVFLSSDTVWIDMHNNWISNHSWFEWYKFQWNDCTCW
jgi:hypothetical protein